MGTQDDDPGGEERQRAAVAEKREERLVEVYMHTTADTIHI
jgi:hypothetical protein